MKIIITNHLKASNENIEYFEMPDQCGSFEQVFFRVRKALARPILEFFVVNSSLAFVKLTDSSNLKAQSISVSKLEPFAQLELKNYFLYQSSKVCAAKNHAGQGYGGFLPYVYHLKQTDKVVDYFFQDIPQGHFFELKCAAQLHDILEDTPVDLKQLQTEYNPEIADIVLKVTKINEKHNLDFEKAYYQEMSKNPLAVFIKIADKCSNTKQTLKNKSGWHAKRLVNGHQIFQDYTYDKVEAAQLKKYLDSLIEKMAEIVAAGDLSDSVKDGVVEA